MNAEFVCMNEIFLIFQFLLQLRPKFSIYISESLKENSILHLLLFFFHSEDGLLIRKLLISWKLNSSAWIKLFLIFQFLQPFRHKLSISICDSLKENSIVHLLLFFFYSEDELLIWKIFLFSELNSSAWFQFPLFFSLLCGWETNSPSELVTVWKRIQFCISSFSSSTVSRNFL